MIKVVENIIPIDAQEAVKSLFLSTGFAWFYHANTNYDDVKTRDNDTPQFCHGFIRDDQSNSPHCAIPLGILNVFGIKQEQIIRAKANLMVREQEPIINPKHTDNNDPHIVFVYYVNSSDGDTRIWKPDGTVVNVSPRQGCGVFFDGQLLHSSTTPIHHRNRMVINFNLRPDAFSFK